MWPEKPKIADTGHDCRMQWIWFLVLAQLDIEGNILSMFKKIRPVVLE